MTKETSKGTGKKGYTPPPPPTKPRRDGGYVPLEPPKKPSPSPPKKKG